MNEPKQTHPLYCPCVECLRQASGQQKLESITELEMLQSIEETLRKMNKVQEETLKNVRSLNEWKYAEVMAKTSWLS